MRYRLTACAGLLALFTGEVVSAQAPAKDPDALAIYCGGIESLLVDPKDKGLLKALRMVDERIMELPAETKQRDMPAGAIRLAWDLLTNPMTLRAAMIPGANQRSGPPFTAQLDFLTPDAGAAETLSQRFAEVYAALAGQPLKAAPGGVSGMKMIDADGVPIILGPQTVEKQSMFSVGLGDVDDTLMAIERGDLPKDARPTMTFRLDPEQLRPFMDMMFANAGPQADGIKQQLSMAGLYGPDAGVIQVAMGSNATNAFAVARRAKYRQLLEKSGMLTTGGLAITDLSRIPADATFAQMARINLRSIGAMINNMAAQASERAGQPPIDAMAMVEKQTGINPQRDVFDHLGESFGLYTSDTTGGGGLMSAVLFAEVKNPEALKKSIALICDMANEISRKEAQGYVRLASRTINDHAMTVLTFPGLPVPIEISVAQSGNWLYAALSPQALLAAIRQGQSTGAGLMDHAAFKQAGGEKVKDAMSFSFIDTPRTMRDGYGLVSLGMAALSNAVRSPSDASRDPGVIMPSLSDLTHGATASLTIARIDKDDLVSVSQCDRSMLVNACGLAGMAGSSTSSIGVSALLVGLLLPALGKAREQAQITRCAASMRLIANAMTIWAAEHNDELPPDLRSLVKNDLLTDDFTRSPIGPVDDAEGDYWINFKVKKFSDVREPNRLVLGYDRATYARGRQVAVVFFDSHVEIMSIEEFDALMNEPPNAGTDFNVPGAD